MAQKTPAPNPMYMLAFDHRQVLRDIYPGAGTADLEATKLAVLDSLDLVSGTVADRASLAYLVDEEYGRAAAVAARERGYYVAMPVEASRTKILQGQYTDYRDRIECLDPQCVKALVFHNPADDADRKRIQFDLLREWGDFARAQGRDYLVEVLMTPTPEQIDRAGGGRSEFRGTLFPELLVESIREMQDAGIEPDTWKVEGLETVEATAAVGAQAMADGRDHVRCIVLGSGESQDVVNGWLANASAVPSFSGFAVGRTVWRDPLGDILARGSRDAALAAMADSFTELIDAFGREPVAVDRDS